MKLTLAEASARIGAGELSPEELTDACLRRHEDLDDQIGAIAFIDPDRARREARALARELVDGARRSPLHGIPIAVKDLIDVKGMPTTAGSRVLAGRVAAADAEVVRRLRAAGAVIVGTATTHEFAAGIITPRASNPWDLTRMTGGSSGGSAAAVASDMCLGALGTDTSGSIRIPAALCGVTGLKPRATQLPLSGIVPLAPSLDSCGPIARDAEDVELIWRALTSGERSLPAPGRIGVPSRSALGELDPDVAAAFDAAAATLAAEGLEVEPVDVPRFEDWDAPRVVPLVREILLTHRQAGWYPSGADQYEPDTRALLERGERVDVDAIVEATQVLRRLTEQLLACFRACEALLLPTTPIPAPPKATATPTVEDDARPPLNRVLTRFTAPINICPLAAISVPCGLSRDGLPIGAQIVAPAEDMVLAVALCYQSHTDHHRRRPPLPAAAS